MKKQIITLASLIGLLCLVGCSTTGNSPFNSQQAAAAIKIAAEDGTVGALLYNPSYRPGFVAATNILSTVQATNLTDISGLLQNLKVGGNSAPYIALALDNATTILNGYGVDLQSLPLTNQLATVQLWQGALLAGVSQGLAISPP